MRRSPLSPFGAASRGLAADAPASSHARLLAELGRNLARFELGPEHAALALEVVSWQDGLDEAQEAALLLGVTCLLVAQARGSTRMPLVPAGEDGGWLRQVLGELLPPPVQAPAQPARSGDAPAPRDLDATVASIQALLADARALPALVGAPGDRRPLIVDRGWLYSQKLHAHEASFAAALRARLEAAPAPAFPPGQLDDALDALRARPAVVGGEAVVLSPEQETAVRRAAAAPFTVVSGGPGTGKTSIVVSILRLLARLGVEPAQVALAAPTGKAAHRMTEAVQRALRAIADPAPEDARLAAAVPEGRTLHRLLGFSPGRGAFLAHPGNPLEHRVVIVDEASMIDMVLMEHLVRAVRPDARLVLLGDADQLPSVAAGAVLRDLVPRDGAAHAALDACAVRLTRSYRMDDRDPQGAAILTFARRVNAPEAPDADAAPDADGASEAWRAALTVRRGVPSLTFSGVEWLVGADPEALDALLARWHAERVEPLRPLARERYRWSQATGSFADDERPALERLFAGLEAGRLLCFTHGSRGGTRHVNAALHRLVLRARGLEGARGERAHDLVAGDPLIVLENDHDRGLWNGDQGVALWVTVDAAPRPRLMAVFRRAAGFVAFHLELLRDRVQRCHAMTVHKAQGSEFDHVAVVLPDHDGPLVTREVLYTAVTRARRSVTLVGQDDVLARAVGRRTARFTGVRERLA